MGPSVSHKFRLPPRTLGVLKLGVLMMGFTLALASCSSTPTNSTSVVIQQDTFVTTPNNTRTLVKKGASVPFEGKPLLLESPGYVSMILVPVANTPSKLTPKLKPAGEWGGENFETALAQKLNTLTSETNQIQTLIAKRNGKEALERIESLQRQFPRITYLFFLRASALYVMGQKAQARVALERGLRDFPNDADARKFYEALGGRIPASASDSPDTKGVKQ